MKNIHFQNVKTDNHARNGILTVNLPLKTKSHSTPILLAQPSSSIEIDYICEWVGKHNPMHFGGLVIPLLSQRKIMASKDSLLHSKTLDDFIDNGKIYSSIRENMLMLADPESENAYYKTTQDDLSVYGGLPKEFVKMAVNISPKRNKKLSSYKDFIGGLLDRSYTYTLQFLKKEKEVKADILLPPSPLIIPEIPESLDVAIKINRESASICKRQEGWVDASYFILRVSFFDDYEQVKPILDYVKNDKPQLLVFKFVDSNSLDSRNAAIQRWNLHRFLKELSNITLKLNIPVFWLNLDSLGIFLALMGVDGFSTPVNGYIQKVFAAPKNIQVPHYLKGSYFHYPLLSMVPFKFIYKMHKKGHFLPCPYGCCDKYNQIKLEHLSILEKSKMCRIHYLNTLNGLLTEIDSAIANKTTRTVVNKLANSSCKHFYEILDGLKLTAEVFGIELETSKEKQSD